MIGANGAGKSSTLRAISGLVKPKGGKILFRGEDITGKNPTEIVSRGITLVPEGRRIFADLTVKENLRVGAYLRKDDISEDMEWVFSLFPRLRDREWQAGGALSGGGQQMLDFSRSSKAPRYGYDDPSGRAERSGGVIYCRPCLCARKRTDFYGRQRTGIAG